MAEQQGRPLSFGSVAEQYERYRPGYGDDVVDAVLLHARRPVRTALEVGAGTGKATRAFASRGIAVTALEPDAEMARVLERTTQGLPVELAPIAFEQIGAGRVDLLYAAAAWHWTDPATRWSRAAELIEPGGVLALFGRPADLLDPALAAAVAEVEREVLPADDPSVVHPWTIEDLAAQEGFTGAVQLRLPSTATTTAAELLGRWGTVSAYLLLSPQARAEAFERVAAVLPEHVEVDTTVTLSLARRA